MQNDNSAIDSDGLQSEPNTDNGFTSNGTPSKSFGKGNNSEAEMQEKAASFRVISDKKLIGKAVDIRFRVSNDNQEIFVSMSFPETLWRSIVLNRL